MYLKKYLLIPEKLNSFFNFKDKVNNDKTKSFKNKELNSSSDNGEYPELALKAALDPATFSVFRRHHKYTGILDMFQRTRGTISQYY